jgi:protein phosphatase
MSLALRPIGHSEIGLVRKTNQDSGFVSPTLLFVADGMGGAAAGDLASAVTANEVQHANDIPMAGKGALTALRIAVVKANNDLAELILRAPELDGMGTTICGGIFDGQSLNIAHIGDSRGYLLRDGTLKRLTHDHSYVQTLIDDGRLDEEGALIHPHRSLIMKVLNGQPDIAPDYFSVELRAGDRIMFCSDGLCGLVRDADISERLASDDPTTAKMSAPLTRRSASAIKGTASPNHTI